MKIEEVRDTQGELLEWFSGRRFAFTDLPKCSIELIVDVGPMKEKLFYSEMKQANPRFKCKKPAHRAFQCFEKKEDRDRGNS